MSTSSNGNSQSTFSVASFGRLFKKSSSNQTLLPKNFEVYFVDGRSVSVELEELKETVKVIRHRELLVKDVIKEACKHLDILPRNCAFFGLYCENSNGTSSWVVQTRPIREFKMEKKQKCFLKLQFKVLAWHELRKRDKNAYEYYLKQCRHEFKNGFYSKYLGSRHVNKENEKILLRMIILEMMMVVKEQSISPLKDILKPKYRKCFNMEEILRKYNDNDGPRDVSKCKQKVEKSLTCFSKVQEPDRDFITEVELLSGYKDEVFYLQKFDRGGNKANNVELWITPKDVAKKAMISNIKHCLWQSPYNMFHRFKVCERDSTRGIKTMILRGDEPPEIVYCLSEDMCETLCSFIEGFYRLLVNQYNSILYDRCDSLQASPYQGNVDREIVPRVLTMKGREGGNYLIREHSKYHGSFILSLITDDDKFVHLQIILKKNDEGKNIYSMDDKRIFNSLEELQDYYKVESHSNEINACLRKIIVPKHSGDVPLCSDPASIRPALPGRKPNTTSLEILGPSLIDVNQIEFYETTQGTFGEVSKSKFKKDGKDLIVKRFPSLTTEMLSEVSHALTHLKNHEYIVQLLGLSLAPDGMFLAFEYLPFGSLYNYMKHHGQEVTYGQLLKFLYQMTDALAAIHSQKLVHADVRFENLFVKDENTIKLGNCCITWKLSGFKLLDERIFRKRYTHLAPEIFLRENAEFSQETDVWSYGLTAWQLFTLQQPFRNCTSQHLMNYFQSLYAKYDEPESKNAVPQPPLVLLNMNMLRHCNELLFNVLNCALHVKSENRKTMCEILKKVQDLLEKAPSKDKQKCYFTNDWDARNREIEENLERRREFMRNRHNRGTEQSHSNDSGYTTLGSAGSQASLLRETDLNSSAGSSFEVASLKLTSTLEANEDTDKIDEETITHILSSDEKEPEEKEFVESADENLEEMEEEKPDLVVKNIQSDELKNDEDKINVSSEECAYVKPENGRIENSFRDDQALTLHDERMEVDVSVRKTSHSAPSSPNKPQMFRPVLIAEKTTDHAEKEFETASILVGLSQTKGPRSEPHKSLASNPLNYGREAMHAATSNYAPHGDYRPASQFMHRALAPFRFGASSSASNDYMKHLQLRMPGAHPTVFPTLEKKKDESSSTSPRPPPPDSPEASRREFPSEQARRDILKDDKTRQTLRERINEEREKSRGKRSLSFTEEFDEFKMNTKRAAKRALLGTNPFNIGIQLPANFLRSDRRVFQATPALPQDVTRFFKSDISPTESVHNKNQSKEEDPSNLAFNPYKNMADIEKYRKNILKNSEIKPTSSPSDIYRTPEEVAAVMKNFQDLHAHSPKSVYDEKYSSAASTSVASASVFTKNSIPSSFKDDTKVNLPYSRSIKGSEAAFSSFSNFLTTSSIAKKSGREKDISSTTYSMHHSSAHGIASSIFSNRPKIYQPEPVRVFRGSSINVLENYPRHAFLHSNPTQLLPVSEGHVPLAPPPLQRHGPPRLFVGPNGEPFFPFQQHAFNPNFPVIPIVRLPNPSVTVKTEPMDDPICMTQSISQPATSAAMRPYEDATSLSSKIYYAKLPKPFSIPKEPSDRLFRYISHKDLKTNEKLGGGQFGEVYDGIWRYTDKNKVTHTVPVAVKRLRRSDQPLSKAALQEFQKEAEAMSRLNSDSENPDARHIIKLYGVCTDDSYEFSIVTEKALASLDCYIASKKKELTVGDVLLYSKQIACGMYYLHSKQFLHRDLACRNVLVADKYLIKICDFGLSRLLHDKGYYRQSTNTRLPIRWLAIEALGRNRYSVESDYWSYGVTLWEIFAIFNKNNEKPRPTPYENVEPKDLHAYLESGNRLKQPEDCPNSLWPIIEKCWLVEPKHRTNFLTFISELQKKLNELEYTM